MGILTAILSFLGLFGLFNSGVIGGEGENGNSPFEVATPAMQEETVTSSPAGGTDYGDAPPQYGIASHSSQDYDWLGLLPTVDDGVSWSPLNLIPGQEATITFIVSAYNPSEKKESWHQYVHSWIDWDQSGSWEKDERIFDFDEKPYWHRYVKELAPNELLQEEVSKEFFVPPVAMVGATWLRVRLGRAWNIVPASDIGFGECEDYEIKVVPEPTTMLLLAVASLGLATLSILAWHPGQKSWPILAKKCRQKWGI